MEYGGIGSLSLSPGAHHRLRSTVKKEEHNERAGLFQSTPENVFLLTKRVVFFRCRRQGGEKERRRPSQQGAVPIVFPITS